MARPSYPRHRVIARGLRQLGVDVVECFVSHRLSGYQLRSALWTEFAKLNGKFDALLVAEFNHAVLPQAWYLARKHKLPLVYDFLISLYDSIASDRMQASPLSPRSLMMWGLDWLATRLPARILVDTSAHCDFYAQAFRANPAKFVVVPLGFEDDIFTLAPPRLPDDKFRILFYSTFIPSHGADVIARAASIVTSADPTIHFTLLGAGQTLQETKNLIKTLQIGNVNFMPPVSAAELPALIGGADITLGVFGNNEKANRAIPNKLYQGLAVGRAAITANTAPAREFFSSGQHVLMCEPGSPESLAESILLLRHNSELRARLAKQGHRHAVENYSPVPIARRVLGALEAL
ncbi:MAG: glycosyltransferase [Chloroflexi bacterium]|nr:glycosyltransferase [Chloroflexota bacterium]